MMQKLPDSTVRQISSGQVINDIPCVVKELVENAIDAGASRVDITLQNFGLDKIEVSDNGSGVSSDDAPNLALRHFTSKLQTFADLGSVSTFGFRGEGLASICAVSDLSVTTRQTGEAMARSYLFNSAGRIITTSFVAAKPGTTIQASRLFANLPVRRNQFRGLRRLQDTLVSIEKLVLAFALTHPSVQLSLVHGMERVFSRPVCKDRQEAVRLVLGRQRSSALTQLTLTWHGIEVEVHLPRPNEGEDKKLFAATPRLTFVFVNGRQVEMVEFHKVLRSLSRDVFSQANRYPTCVLFLSLPSCRADVNLEPNKTRVVFEEMKDLLAWLPQAIMLELAMAKDDAAPAAPAAPQQLEPDPLAWSMGRCLAKQPTNVVAEGKENSETAARSPDIRQISANQQLPSPIANANALISANQQLPSPIANENALISANQPLSSPIANENALISNGDRSVNPFEFVGNVERSKQASCPEFSSPGNSAFAMEEPPSSLTDLQFPPIFSSEPSVDRIFTPNREASPLSTNEERWKAIPPSTNQDSLSPANQKASSSAGTPFAKNVASPAPVKRRASEGPERPVKRPRRSDDALSLRRSEEASFCLGSLRKRLEGGCSTAGPSQRAVIGVMRPLDACVVREGSQLFFANSKRLVEMAEETRLARDCQLPSVRLPTPLRLEEVTHLPPEAEATLVTLATKEVFDSRGELSCEVVAAPALLKNGFRVHRLPDNKFEVVHVPAPFEHDFGPVMGELLVQLPRHPDPAWRPHSVQRHFLIEAQRLARCLATEKMSPAELERRCSAILCRSESLRSAQMTCGHGKVAMLPLWRLPTSSRDLRLDQA